MATGPIVPLTPDGDPADARRVVVAMKQAGAPLCLDCLAQKLDMPRRRLDTVLAYLANVVKLAIESSGRCSWCAASRRTFDLR